MSENKNTNVADLKQKYKKQSQFKEIFKRLLRNKSATAGAIVVILLLFMAIFADALHDYETQVIKQDIMNRLQSPSAEHWFGTDEMGRDIFARVCYGAKYSLLIGFTGAVTSLVLGIVLGALAGFYGGKIDNIIMTPPPRSAPAPFRPRGSRRAPRRRASPLPCRAFARGPSASGTGQGYG